MKKTIVCICGPTAVGKTEVSLQLASRWNSEILSFDSRQFFRELQIGAAPPSPDALARVPHHFIGHLSVTENFNAGDFETMALERLDQLFRKHDVVFLVGGSGLYLKALTEGFDTMPDIDPELRETLNETLKTKGLAALQDELRATDREYSEKADLQNPQRVIRALEVIRSTGKPYSYFRKQTLKTRPFHTVKIGLELQRPELYQRIEQRVEQMLAAGLEEEVRHLQTYQDQNALKTVGYKEFFRFFEGTLSREEVISEIKKNSRRYAKRQLTWFKRDPEIRWFSPHHLPAIVAYLEKVLGKP